MLEIVHIYKSVHHKTNKSHVCKNQINEIIYYIHNLTNTKMFKRNNYS